LDPSEIVLLSLSQLTVHDALVSCTVIFTSDENVPVVEAGSLATKLTLGSSTTSLPKQEVLTSREQEYSPASSSSTLNISSLCFLPSMFS
jgi:hypothetical protein